MAIRLRERPHYWRRYDIMSEWFVDDDVYDVDDAAAGRVERARDYAERGAGKMSGSGAARR